MYEGFSDDHFLLVGDILLEKFEPPPVFPEPWLRHYTALVGLYASGVLSVFDLSASGLNNKETHSVAELFI